MSIYKKCFLCCSLVGNAVLFTLMVKLFSNNLSKTNPEKKEFTKSDTSIPVKKVSIALLHSATGPLIDAIIQGFKEGLAKNPTLQCSYTPYDNRGDRTLLRSHVEDVISKNFDLIFTLGHSATAMTAGITRKRNCRTPVVFSNVEDPVKAGVVPKDRDRNCYITGLSAQVNDYEKQFSLLLLLKPDLKRLLIPYDPRSGSAFQSNIDNAEAYMSQQGIPVQKIEIFSVAECLQKITPFVQSWRCYMGSSCANDSC